VNDILVRAIRAINIHAELEPNKLLRNDGKRPDGATLDPWRNGRYLVWDFTSPDTLAPSHIKQTSLAAGTAALEAERNKHTKYQEIVSSNRFIFAPIAIETLGAWGPSAQEILKELGSRIAKHTGDARSFTFLKQRLDIAIQRGNAASIAGTFHEHSSNKRPNSETDYDWESILETIPKKRS
jgi:hypothetical protein